MCSSDLLELMAKYGDEARDTLFPLLSTNRVRIDLDVERLTHVLRVEPLVHGLVLTALTDSNNLNHGYDI